MPGILLNTHELSEFEQDILGVGRLRGRCQCLCHGRHNYDVTKTAKGKGRGMPGRSR